MSLDFPRLGNREGSRFQCLENARRNFVLLRRREGLGEVGGEVVTIFEAHGEADEAVVDAAGVTLGGRHSGVRHHGRIGQDALDAAEADGG